MSPLPSRMLVDDCYATMACQQRLVLSEGTVCVLVSPGGGGGFKDVDKIRNGPNAGWVATSLLPPRGPDHFSARGVQTASQRGRKSEMAHRWAGWLHNPCRLKVANRFREGIKSEMAHMWAGWLHNPCRLGVQTA